MTDPTPHEDNAESKPEWETPELFVEMVATVTEGNFSSTHGDDGLGSGS